MYDEKRHFDEDSDMRVSNKLSADLKALFRPDMSVPPEVDRGIMDRAYQQLVRRHKNRRIFRFSACAAVAVVVFLVLTLDIIREPHPAALHSDIVAVRTDIDQNGSVNVLDAFRLARHIESTDRPDMKWDINGDGFVNYDDVDSVAFSAVRLDKGVL